MNEFIGEVSEDEARGLLGSARYCEYTMARALIEIQHGRPAQAEGSGDGLATGTILLFFALVLFFLVSWLLEGHPGSFFGWFWQEMLRSIN